MRGCIVHVPSYNQLARDFHAKGHISRVSSLHFQVLQVQSVQQTYLIQSERSAPFSVDTKISLKLSNVWTIRSSTMSSMSSRFFNENLSTAIKRRSSFERLQSTYWSSERFQSGGMLLIILELQQGSNLARKARTVERGLIHMSVIYFWKQERVTDGQEIWRETDG